MAKGEEVTSIKAKWIRKIFLKLKASDEKRENFPEYEGKRNRDIEDGQLQENFPEVRGKQRKAGKFS